MGDADSGLGWFEMGLVEANWTVESGETSVRKVTTLPYKFVLFLPPNKDPFLFC